MKNPSQTWLVSATDFWTSYSFAFSIKAKHFDSAALKIRADTIKLDQTSEASLKAKGMAIDAIDRAPFLEKLRVSGYYADWKATFGDQAWSVLEAAVGPLT